MTGPPADSAAAAIDTVAHLARSTHRVAVLTELSAGPRDRTALREATGASSPTVGRILADFADRQWISRNGAVHELTRLGEFVAAEFLSLQEAMALERRLRDVWPWLPREMDGFSVQLFADAVVSYPGPGYPYEPVERIAELLGAADSMRGFGATMVKSGNLEPACRAIDAGLTFEFVYEPAVLEAVRAWNPARIEGTMANENCTAYVHESLPDGGRCGLDLYDDRVAICCHDGATGALRAVVDTGAPEALAWAEGLYEQIRTEARPLEGDARGPDSNRG